MRQTVWNRVDVFARQLTPFALTLLLVLVSMVPIPVPGLMPVTPMLTLLAVYHWSVARPELMPAYAVFLIGLTQDLLTGTPIGLNATVLLMAYGIVIWQHRFLAGKSFGIVWLGFALVALGGAALGWVLGALYHGEVLPVRVMAVQYAVTLGLYPLLAWAFLRWQRAFLSQL